MDLSPQLTSSVIPGPPRSACLPHMLGHAFLEGPGQHGVGHPHVCLISHLLDGLVATVTL